MSMQWSNLPSDPLEAYIAGLRAGYWARLGEENEQWQAKMTKESVTERDLFIVVSGERIRVWSWRDRKAKRIEILREGHAAGFHTAPAIDCPDCPDV